MYSRKKSFVETAYLASITDRSIAQVFNSLSMGNFFPGRRRQNQISFCGGIGRLRAKVGHDQVGFASFQ